MSKINSCKYYSKILLLDIQVTAHIYTKQTQSQINTNVFRFILFCSPSFTILLDLYPEDDIPPLIILTAYPWGEDSLL